jgi:hypothetical protein
MRGEIGTSKEFPDKANRPDRCTEFSATANNLFNIVLVHTSAGDQAIPDLIVLGCRVRKYLNQPGAPPAKG